jgi:hypothetical protein
MNVDHGMFRVFLIPIPLGRRVLQSLVVDPLGELQHPTGRRHRHLLQGTSGGKVSDPREHHFGSIDLDKYATARRSTAFPFSSIRMRRFASRSSSNCSRVTPGLLPSAMSACRNQFEKIACEFPKSLGICL